MASTADAQVTSQYTDLIDTKCKTLELTDDEGGSYKGECRGIAGYKLYVTEGDLRQSVDIVDPNGGVSELQFWNHFSAFSYLGPRAEWRIRNKKPVALIVRLNVSEDPEDSSKTTSYLIVAKITTAETCITDIIGPSRTQNVQARQAADRSAASPCKVK